MEPDGKVYAPSAVELFPLHVPFQEQFSDMAVLTENLSLIFFFD